MKKLILPAALMLCAALLHAEGTSALANTTTPPAPTGPKATTLSGAKPEAKHIDYQRAKEEHMKDEHFREEKKMEREHWMLRREEALHRIDEHLMQLNAQEKRLAEQSAKLREMQERNLIEQKNLAQRKAELLEHKHRIERAEAGSNVDLQGIVPHETSVHPMPNTPVAPTPAK